MGSKTNTVGILRHTTVSEAGRAFEGHLVYKKRSPLTTRQYAPVLRDFAAWAGERSPASISTYELEGGFLAHWIQEFEARNLRPPSGYAVKGVIVALRSFYKYLSNYRRTR